MFVYSSSKCVNQNQISTERIAAVQQNRVRRRMAVARVHRAIPVPQRTVESGDSVAIARLQAGLGRHRVRAGRQRRH